MKENTYRQIIILRLVSLFFFVPTCAYSQHFAGGSGTVTDPYLIETPQHLDNLRNYVGSNYANTHFRLENDIDLENYIANNYSAKGWIPIAGGQSWEWGNMTLNPEYAFQGYLHGNNHIIKGLWMNDDSWLFYTGLFRYIYQAHIENLGIETINNGISGRAPIGALAGGMNGGSISGCYTNAYVTGAEKYVAGLVGYVTGTVTISDCYTRGDVIVRAGGAGSHYAGLAGYIGTNVIIENCYAYGNILAQLVASGLVAESAGVIRNSAAINRSIRVDNPSQSTGVDPVHRIACSGGTFLNNYASNAINLAYIKASGSYTPDPDPNGLDGGNKFDSDLQNANTYTAWNWDFNNIWKIIPGSDYMYPVFKWQIRPDCEQLAGDVRIGPAEDCKFPNLQAAANHYNECGLSADTRFIITNNITATGNVVFRGTAPGCETYSLIIMPEEGMDAFTIDALQVSGTYITMIGAKNITFDGGLAPDGSTYLIFTGHTIDYIPLFSIEEDVSRDDPGENITLKNITIYTDEVKTGAIMQITTDAVTSVSGCYLHTARIGIFGKDITQVKLENNVLNNLFEAGIYIENSNPVTNADYRITGNEISIIVNDSTYFQAHGIAVNPKALEGSEKPVIGGNIIVSGNTISSITNHVENNGYYARGINLNVAGNLELKNNVIDGIFVFHPDGQIITNTKAHGIYVLSSGQSDIVIDSCRVSNISADGHASGISIYKEIPTISVNALISHCDVREVENNQQMEDSYGIYSEADESVISANAVYGVRNIGGNIMGIYVKNPAASRTLIANNMVGSIISTCVSPECGTFGIYSNAPDFNIFHNTVVMNLLSSADSEMFAVFCPSGNSSSAIRNNILASLDTHPENSALIYTGTSTQFSGNRYYSKNGFIGYVVNGTNKEKYTDITNWSVTTKDNSSLLSSIPVFTNSISDFHLSGASQTDKILGVSYNPAFVNITEDFDGEARATCCNRAGADNILNTNIHWDNIWAPASNSTDWNNYENWSGKAVPEFCTNVLIPQEMNSYPVLKITDTATCDTISFEMGGEVAKTHYLSYKAAKVNLKLPKINQWYTVSAPLRNMYSGDYFVESSFSFISTGILPGKILPRQNPTVFGMIYQAMNPQTGYIASQGEWSKPFNSLDVELKPGMGFSTWVDEGERNPGDNFTMYFPKDSTMYNYYIEDSGAISRQTGTLERTNKSFFIYEAAQGYAKDGDGSFSVEVTSDQLDDKVFPTALIGNPFMSHLDLNIFQDTNSSKITSGWQIWSGNSFNAALSVPEGLIYTTEGPGATVAPMQSFIVNKVNPTVPLQSLQFSIDMSVTVPKNILRSTSVEIPDVLKLSINRDGEFLSGIALHYKAGTTNLYDPGKDVWTMFANKISESAVVYALLEGKAASILTTSDFSVPVELGIRSTSKGWLTLAVSGTENFNSGFDIFLEDRKNGVLQDLRKNPEYAFNNETGDVQNRFFLKITGQASELGKTSSDNIILRISDNRIYVSSDANDPINSIEVFDLQGRLIERHSTLNTGWFELDKKEPLVIIRVRTTNTIKTGKF